MYTCMFIVMSYFFHGHDDQGPESPGVDLGYLKGGVHSSSLIGNNNLRLLFHH